jgi:hypothetical protein
VADADPDDEANRQAARRGRGGDGLDAEPTGDGDLHTGNGHRPGPQRDDDDHK